MEKRLELPLVPPVYSTYHFQGNGSAVIAQNPSIRNWYLNQVLMLSCTRKFLSGFTTPEISIEKSSWNTNPYLETKWYNAQHLGGYIHYVIRNLLHEGYYVCFDKVDDYYIPGKSWYHERHFPHDGCICGYNQSDKTYLIFAYDQNWLYRKFSIPQKGFLSGVKARIHEKSYPSICGVRTKNEEVLFSPDEALGAIRTYLNATTEQYPENGEGTVLGHAVHHYLARYVDKLAAGEIPYERMDRRVFRVIWEHKVIMAERILKIEEALSLDAGTSRAYAPLVKEAHHLRMLYAAHHMKRRDELLPILSKRLRELAKAERTVLEDLLRKARERKQK